MRVERVALVLQDSEGRTRSRYCKVSELAEVTRELHEAHELQIMQVLPCPEAFHAPVLDHGYVTLVDYMGDDLQPLRSARLSTGNATGVDEEKDNRLRNRLWGDTHTSPFEACELAVEVQLPILCLRQIDRHRTTSVSEMKIESVEDYDDFRKYTSRNEFSARYSEMPDMFWVPELDRYRAKGVANKQGSGGLLPEEDRRKADLLFREAIGTARLAYEGLLRLGVASEVARGVLPASQYTKVHLKASLLNWFKFLKLRMAPDVQEETRLYANAIGACVQQLWPLCWEVFEQHTLRGVALTKDEVAFVVALVQANPHEIGPDFQPAWQSLQKKLQNRG